MILKLMEKLKRLPEIRIVIIPADMDKERALGEVVKKLATLL